MNLITRMNERAGARVLGLAIPDDLFEPLRGEDVKIIKIDFDSLEDLLKSMDENELESIFNS